MDLGFLTLKYVFGVPLKWWDCWTVYKHVLATLIFEIFRPWHEQIQYVSRISRSLNNSYGLDARSECSYQSLACIESYWHCQVHPRLQSKPSSYLVTIFFNTHEIGAEKMLKHRITHSFLVPFLTEIHVVSVNDKENVDYNEQMVSVPEGIEASKFL